MKITSAAARNHAAIRRGRNSQVSGEMLLTGTAGAQDTTLHFARERTALFYDPQCQRLFRACHKGHARLPLSRCQRAARGRDAGTILLPRRARRPALLVPHGRFPSWPRGRATSPCFRRTSKAQAEEAIQTMNEGAGRHSGQGEERGRDRGPDRASLINADPVGSPALYPRSRPDGASEPRSWRADRGTMVAGCAPGLGALDSIVRLLSRWNRSLLGAQAVHWASQRRLVHRHPPREPGEGVCRRQPRDDAGKHGDADRRRRNCGSRGRDQLCSHAQRR